MHPLSQQIRAIGHRARRLLVWRGLAWWSLTLLATVFLAGLVDYWLRSDERVLRWLGTLAVLAAALVGWLRLVVPAWRVRPGEAVVAHWIELKFPDLRDRLTSAVAFLRQSSPDIRFGSPALRQLVVRDATAAVADRDLRVCLDSRPTCRAGIFLFVGAAILATLCAVDVRSATIAARRLAMPWRDESWPRRNWLVFTRRPEKLAVGQDFLVELMDRNGWLPTEVTLYYWFDGDDESQARSQRMIYAGGRMTHKLPQVTRSFRYRAVGGDDREMPWTQLNVVTPPRIVQTTARLYPPRYTGLPEQSAPAQIRGLAGTTVEISGKLDRPISRALLQITANQSIQSLPAAVSADGLEFHLPSAPDRPWQLQESGSYGWLFTDRDGLSIPVHGKWALDVLQDAPPTISVEAPLADASFTSSATIPIRLVVKDDLAVQQIVMQTGEAATTIRRQETPPAIAASDWPPRGEQRLVEYRMSPRERSGLKAGDTLTLRFIASDFKPQDSPVAEVKIAIISQEELLQRIELRQASLLQRLQDALRLQRALRSQAGAARSQPLTTDTGTGEISSLSSIELGQRRIRGQMDGDDGAIRLVGGLLEELANNAVEDLQLKMHLSQLLDDLRRIAKERLPPIEQQLVQAEKCLRVWNSHWKSHDRSSTPPDESVVADYENALQVVCSGQDQVVYELEELVDRLSQWSGYRLLAQEVDQIRLEQETLSSETRTTSTTGRELIQLGVGETAVLRQLSLRQAELAGRLDRLQRRLERMRQRFGEASRLATAAMDEALAVLREAGTNGRMREAARQVSENQIGSANTLQQQILSDLLRLYDALSQRPEQDLERLTRTMREAADEIKSLGAQQTEVARQAAAAATLDAGERREALNEIARTEGELTKSLEQFTRRLQRLLPANAGESLQKAAGQMQSAERSASQGDPSAAAASAKQAAEQIEEVRQELARLAADTDRKVAAFQERMLEQQLLALWQAQTTLHAHAVQLAMRASNAGELPSEGQEEARQLSIQQQELSDAAAGAGRQFESLAVFAWSLDRTAQRMAHAARLLAAARVGQETTGSQQAAIDQLRELLNALHGQAPELDEPRPDQPSPPATPPDGSQTDRLQPRLTMAELRVLHAWQLAINRRTAELAGRRAPDLPWTPEQQRELTELAADQQKIADMLDRLMPPQ